jgi:hypothetical protein
MAEFGINWPSGEKLLLEQFFWSPEIAITKIDTDTSRSENIGALG